jgi:PAS domain S-box-containing protein
MNADDKVNILLVDDQPAKLLSYEVILQSLGENLLKATSAGEALEQLLRHDVAVVLMDVSMPELDGFELAAMIREHPRFQETAIIFVSAIHLADGDFLRGYAMGAVDYVPVPVVAEVLRAKVRIFVELHRKTRQLEQLNRDLEKRVSARTAELAASSTRLRDSEERRSLALSAGQMGSWDWDLVEGDCQWDEGQLRIFGVDPATFVARRQTLAALMPDDWPRIESDFRRLSEQPGGYQTEFRVRRPDGETRWCLSAAASSADESGRVVRISGVTIDISDRKLAEERQVLLAREVDHRAKNALALVQSIVKLSRGRTIDDYVSAVDGRIMALSRAHTLLAESRWQGADLAELIEEEFAPYRSGDQSRIGLEGPRLSLEPRTAQSIALALHELTTNAAKYGALSVLTGRVDLTWDEANGSLRLRWSESGGPRAPVPAAKGFGLRVIRSSIEGQLGGSAGFEWRSDGLRCTLTVPLAARRGEATPIRLRGTGAAPPARHLGGRVLVVEDEVLIAAMMRDLLLEAGCAVIGPFATVAEALAAADRDKIDSAILDINLAKELVYPVAEVLRARDIPFAFVTGYGQESIDPNYANVTILEKPVDRARLQGLFRVPAKAIKASRRNSPPRLIGKR